jgi:hypothetical protein
MFRGSAGVPPALAGILPASKTGTDSKTAESRFFAVSVADTPRLLENHFPVNHPLKTAKSPCSCGSASAKKIRANLRLKNSCGNSSTFS